MADEEDEALPAERFNFTLIQALPHKPKGTQVDVAGILVSVNGPEEIKTKTGNQMQKLVLTLGEVNQLGGVTVECTLWNEQLNNLDMSALYPGTAIALKNVRVSDWNTVSLAYNAGSSMQIGNKSPQDAVSRDRYYQFFQGGGFDPQQGTVNALSVRSAPNAGDASGDNNSNKNAYLGRRFLSAIEEEKLGADFERSDYFDCTCIVTRFGRMPNGIDSLFYVAAPDTMKKVDSDHHGGWICGKTNKHYTDAEVQRRYLFQLEVCDRVST